MNKKRILLFICFVIPCPCHHLPGWAALERVVATNEYLLRIRHAVNMQVEANHGQAGFGSRQSYQCKARHSHRNRPAMMTTMSTSGTSTKMAAGTRLDRPLRPLYLLPQLRQCT